MMTLKRGMIGALAAVLMLPLVASAQQQWDGVFDFDDLNDNFLTNPLVDFGFVEGADVEAEAELPETGIDDNAEFRLLEFVLNNPEALNHQTVLDAFTTTYPIVDSRVANTDVGLIFRAPGSKVLTGLMIRSIDLGVEIGTAFDIEDANAFTQQELDSVVELFGLLSASGDFDNDGITNLQEWLDSDLGGAQTYEERVSLFVTLATSGTTESVNVNPGSATVFAGTTAQLSASSTDNQDTFTWESDNGAVATVSGTGLVTGVSQGTATITARGSNSNAVGSATITVETPQWFDLCALDNTFANQGAVFGGLASQLGLPFSSFAEFDLDQDGAPDAWQLHHLAYVLCQGGFGLESKNVLPSNVVAEFQANSTEVATLISELGAFVTFLNAVNGDIAAFADTLANSVDAAVCNDPANLPPSLAGPYAAVFGPAPINLALAGIAQEANDAAGDFAPLALVLPSLAELLTGLSGLSTEYGLAINSIVPFSDISDLVQVSGLIAGIAQFQAACLSTPAEQGEAGALAVAMSAPPSVAVPSFTVYGSTTKLPGEPFAGAGDYNNDGIDNTTIAGFVQGASGDENDYVAGVTGELGDFWLGNPALSAVGLLGLGAALSALSAAGAFALRRKK